jgi:hypothetical protein
MPDRDQTLRRGPYDQRRHDPQGPLSNPRETPSASNEPLRCLDLLSSHSPPADLGPNGIGREHNVTLPSTSKRSERIQSGPPTTSGAPPASPTASSEPDAGADQDWERPPRALAVDIPQAFFDQPVHVRQTAHETELCLCDELEGTHSDEQPPGRTEAERPRIFEELAILRGEPRVTLDGTPTNVPRMSWCRLMPTR